MTLALALTVLLGLLLLAWSALDEPAAQSAVAAAVMLVMFGRPVGRRRPAPGRYAGRHAGTPARYVGRHWALTAATA